MIPEVDYNLVLPPFVGDVTRSTGHSPYPTTLVDVIDRFGRTPARRNILRGLIRYRDWLRTQMGLRTAAQWLDGSFVENSEILRFRPPGDIDVVTFFERPTHLLQENDLAAFIAANAEHFDSQFLKETYHCDAYVHDLNVPSAWTVRISTFWYGLFSHQRGSRLWKGMVEVSLTPDDNEALALLDRMDGDVEAT